MKKKLPYQIESSHSIFKGARFNVCVNKVFFEEDHVYEQEVIEHPGAVVILPLLDKETVVMIQNERYAVNEQLWELPAGTLEKGEQPLETAKRELVEETGYSANQMEALLRFYSTPGFCTENMYVYLATGLSSVGQHLDDSEKISVHSFSWNRVLEMISDNSICDAKTIASLLYYQQFRRSMA